MCTPPSPRHAWLWGCPIGGCPRTRCSGRSKWLLLHPLCAHTPLRLPRDSSCSLSSLQETCNALYLHSKIFSFPSFVCFPNPHFFFGTPSRERHPLLPHPAPGGELGIPRGFSALLPCLWHLVLLATCHPGGALRGVTASPSDQATPWGCLPLPTANSCSPLLSSVVLGEILNLCSSPETPVDALGVIQHLQH